MQISLINLIKTATLNNNPDKKFDVRIICSNKKSLVKLMKAGKFRQDLLFQINTCSLSIPPLRKSKEDILILAKYFLQQYSDKQGETEFTLSKKSLDKLQTYDWPGNVKELKNIIFSSYQHGRWLHRINTTNAEFTFRYSCAKNQPRSI